MLVADIQQKTASLFEKHDIAYAAVFGSVARDEANEASDVDILVRFSAPKTLLDLARIERELGAVLGREVDLVTERALSPYIKDVVMQDLEPLYEKRSISNYSN